MSYVNGRTHEQMGSEESPEELHDGKLKKEMTGERNGVAKTNDAMTEVVSSSVHHRKEDQALMSELVICNGL